MSTSEKPLLTPAMITREALKILHSNHVSLSEIGWIWIPPTPPTTKLQVVASAISNWKHRIYKCWQVLRYDADID